MTSGLENKTKNKISIKKYVPFILAGLVFAFLEVLGELLDKLQEVSNDVAKLWEAAETTEEVVAAAEASVTASISFRDVALLGVKGLGWWILLTVIIFALWHGGRKAYHSTPSKLKVFGNRFFTWTIIMVCWIPCFIAYFPGIYSYDGEPQLLQYTSGQFDNHHPVLHTLIMGWCYDLGQWLMAHGIMIDGIAFYSIIQMSLLAFALATVVVYLSKRNAGRVFIWLTMGLFALYPVTPIMAISTTKDTFFTALFVLLLVNMLELAECGKGVEEGKTSGEGKAEEKGKATGKGKVEEEDKAVEKNGWKKKAVIVGVIAVLAMLFRRNVSYVIILMTMVSAVTWLINRGKKKSAQATFAGRVAIICLISFVVFEASEKAVLTVTDAVPGEAAEALSVPLMQMARAFKSNDYEVRTSEYSEVLFSYVTETGLCNYRPLISDGVKQYFNNEHFKEDKVTFVKLYFDMMKDYPSSYVQAFLYMTKGYWQLMDDSFCEVYKNWWRDRTGYLITDATPVFALDFVQKTNLWPSLRKLYESFATDSSYRCFFLLQMIFAPAMYVMLIVLGGVALIKKKSGSRLLIWLFIGFYLLTMIAGPCVLVRYVFPLMMVCPLVASMIYDGEAGKMDF